MCNVHFGKCRKTEENLNHHPEISIVNILTFIIPDIFLFTCMKVCFGFWYYIIGIILYIFFYRFDPLPPQLTV